VVATSFNPLLTAFGTYVDPSTSNGATNKFRTAKGYIPEWTWNDSTVPNTTIDANIPYLDTSNNTNIVAASGGKSDCSDNSTNTTTVGTCNSGYAKPAWQRGAGVPSDSARDLPDISLMAGAGGDGAAWLVCTDAQGDNGSGVTVTADCSNQSDGHFYFFGFGGTSTSAPAFAGILALVQQKTGGRLGQAATELYDLYNGAHSAAIFHDVTIGNISVPCGDASPDCQQNTAGNLFLTGYETTAGYDLATGIGSVDVAQLINYWGTAVGATATTITVTPSATSINRADPITVDITLLGAATPGNPTGTVTLSGGGFTSTAQTLAASGADSGTATINIPGNSLNKGADTLTVSYSGDTNYASKTGTTSVTVTAPTPTVTVTPSPSTILRSNPLSVTVAVAGSGGTPSGSVTLSGGGYTSGATSLVSGSATISIPANSLSAGSDVLTATYSGDPAFNTATGTATVTVNTPLTPTITLTPSATTIAVSQAITVGVAVTGTGAVPTGTVTLSGGGFTSSAGTLVAGAFTVNIPANSLAAGSDTLTVTYSGDTVYSSATKPVTITVNAPSFTILASDVTVSAGTAGSSTVTITPSGGYTGTVTLTAAVTASPAGAVSAPTLTGSTVTITNATPPPGTVTVNTTPATAARNGGTGSAWFQAAGGTVFAAFLLFCVPLGSRRGRKIFGVLLLVTAATFTAVGCGTSVGGGGGSKKTTPSVTVSASKGTFSSDTAITVSVSVSGGTQAATGNVTLTGGGFTGTATALASGAASFNIPANTLSSGSVTLTGSYAGDTNFNSATGTTTVTVNKPKTSPGAYTVTVTGTGSDGAHTTKTATFTLNVN
jgi:trimeric autotransporter adhesin